MELVTLITGGIVLWLQEFFGGIIVRTSRSSRASWRGLAFSSFSSTESQSGRPFAHGGLRAEHSHSCQEVKHANNELCRGDGGMRGGSRDWGRRTRIKCGVGTNATRTGRGGARAGRGETGDTA